MVACFISVTLFLRTAHGGVTVCVSSSGGNGTHSVPLRLPRKGGPLGQGLGAWLLRGVVSGPERRTGQQHDTRSGTVYTLDRSSRRNCNPLYPKVKLPEVLSVPFSKNLLDGAEQYY
jgi:hypothetical protein